MHVPSARARGKIPKLHQQLIGVQREAYCLIGNLDLIGVQRVAFQTGFILRESPLEPDELLIC